MLSGQEVDRQMMGKINKAPFLLQKLFYFDYLSNGIHILKSFNPRIFPPVHFTPKCSSILSTLGKQWRLETQTSSRDCFPRIYANLAWSEGCFTDEETFVGGSGGCGAAGKTELGG